MNMEIIGNAVVVVLGACAFFGIIALIVRAHTKSDKRDAFHHSLADAVTADNEKVIRFLCNEALGSGYISQKEYDLHTAGLKK